jgi:transcriptional regulator with XRE-family HTH domain
MDRAIIPGRSAYCRYSDVFDPASQALCFGSKEPDMNPTILDPKLFGFWARCVRETQHLSQDTLAVNAGVTIRTVQRFEAGQVVNVTSRRALAKALGYDNPDTFDDPTLIQEVLNFFDHLNAMQQKNLDDQHPDHERLKAQTIASGQDAIQFADAVGAISFTIDDGFANSTKESRPASATTCKT